MRYLLVSLILVTTIFIGCNSGGDGGSVIQESDRVREVSVYPFNTTNGFTSDIEFINVAIDENTTKTYALVADWENGLFVADMEDPENTTLVGISQDPLTAYNAIAFRENLAYVCDLVNGLQVIDLSNLSSPVKRGFKYTNGVCESVELLGEYALVGSGVDGFSVIGISDPDNLVNHGVFSDPDYTREFGVHYSRGLTRKGNYLFVADSKNVQIIDVADPLNPAYVKTIQTPGIANSSTLSQDEQYLFVADSDNGVVIIDISDVNDSTIISTVDTDGRANKIYEFNDRLYVANGAITQDGDGTSGIVEIDISNPSAPKVLDTFKTDDAQSIRYDGDYFYVADGASGMKVIKVGDVTGSIHYKAVAVKGNYAYVHDGYNGLSVIDVSNPSTPILVYKTVGEWDDRWDGYVKIDGDTLYLGRRAYAVYDISDPLHPQKLNNSRTWGPSAMDISGNYAFFGDFKGLSIADVSDPANPKYISRDKFNDNLTNLEINGSYAYTIDIDGNFQVLNISNPEAVVSEANIDLGTLTWELIDNMVTVGNYVFANSAYTGYVVDVSNPSNPVVTKSSFSGYSLFVDNNLLYVGKYRGYLDVYDITTPTSPRFVYSKKISTEPIEDVTVVNNLVYTVSGPEGLKITGIF